jgi:EmrB/QacA subfamily drug resistance transporter
MRLASVLASLMLTLFLAALDQTIVATATPTILRDLNGFDRYIWPITAYLVASTTVIPIVGKLSDQFGRKWFMLSGVTIFLIGSALSGATKVIASQLLSWQVVPDTTGFGDPMNLFIAFRGLQGLGAGILLSLVFTTVGDIFPPAARARWQGLFSGVFGLAAVVGPTAGGYITDAFGWPWIFDVNLPLGILALFLLLRYLPRNLSVRSTTSRGWAALRRIDWLGALLASGGTICLLLGLTWGSESVYPWNSQQVIGILAGAAISYLLFLLVERFIAKEPILPLDLFKNRVFAAGALLALTVGMALFSVVIYVPLFIQDVLGQSATDSGALITPLTLTLAISAALVGFVIARVGRYQWISILGALVLTGAVFLLAQLNASSPVLDITRNMIVVGVGLGMLQPVLTLAVQNAIPRTRLGVGTGAVTYLRSLGQTLGVAVVGAVEASVFSNALSNRLPSGIAQLPADAQAQLTNQALLQRVLGDPTAQSQLVAQATQRADAQVVPQIVAQTAPQAIAKVLPQAIAQATAQVPPGPQHDQMVAAITQQVTAQVTQQVTAQVTAQVTQQVNTQLSDTLHQLFEAARLSLADGIQHAFWVALGVGALIVVITLFLKDVPLTKRFQDAPRDATVAAEEALASATGVEEPAMAPVDF